MKRPILIAGLLIGLAAAAASSVFAAGSAPRKAPEEVSSPYPGLLPPPADGGIFYGGRQVSLTEAESALSFPLYRPNDELASDATIKRVWIETLEGDEPSSMRAAIEYTSGVLVKVEAEWIGTPQEKAPCEDECQGTDTPPSSFAELAERLAAQLATKDVPAADFLATVKGGLALVTPFRQEIAPGSIMFSYQGVRITVFGDLDQATLLRIAESVS